MMESLYLLLPLSVVFALGIGAAFWWAIFSGQFDDTQRAAESVLLDDDSTLSPDAGTDTTVQAATHAGKDV